MSPETYDATTLDQKIELAGLYQSLKASRQIAFQAHVAMDEKDEDIRQVFADAEALYCRMTGLIGVEPEPVFDERTYVPNPDRWG